MADQMSQALEGGREIIALLRDIERRSRDHAQSPPRQRKQRHLWEGIVFTIGDVRFTAPIEEVKEILNLPAGITPVPGTKKWVRGVANIRGSLLPIIDLKQFLEGGTTKTGRRNRVLVIDRQGVYTGLLVGEMARMRHFYDADRRDVAAADLVADFGPFVKALYVQQGEKWPVFDIPALLEDQNFLVAAL